MVGTVPKVGVKLCASCMEIIIRLVYSACSVPACETSRDTYTGPSVVPNIILYNNPSSGSKFSQTYLCLLIQSKLLATNHQGFRIHFHQWIIKLILDMFQHIYLVRFIQELKLLCRVIPPPIRLGQYINCFQS